MAKIIGRKEEISILQSLQKSDRSSFVAVYGRRRVGKTYLIRSFFEEKFTFQLTGIANVETEQQLTNFHSSLIRQFPWLTFITTHGLTQNTHAQSLVHQSLTMDALFL